MIDNNKVWVAGASLIAVVVVAGGWFLGVSPLLSAAAVSDSDRASVDAQNAAQAIDLESLKTRYAGLPALSADLAAIKTAIPADADYANLLREVSAAATASGTTLLSFGTADAATFAPAAADAAAAPAPATDAASDPAVDTATVPSPEADALVPAAASPESLALVSGGNFVTLPVTLSASGTYDSVMAFVKAIQSTQRLYLVTTLSIAPGATGSDYVVNVDGFAYTLTESDAVTPAPATVETESATTTLN